MNRRFLPTVFLLNLLFLTNLSWGQNCNGGMVTTATGGTTAYTCPGDGNADALDFAHSGNSANSFAYVVTDENGIILGLPPGNTVDFEGAGTGNCLVWGLSYTGNLTAQVGDDAATATLSDDCFDLSDNFVTVKRDVPDGGRVYTTSGDTTDYTCPGDGNADEISFMVNGNSNSKFQYVVTDDQGTILGLPPGNTVNFEGAGIGNCLVWGLSYTGNLTAQMGDNALTTHLSDDCFDLSDNYVSIQRDDVDGGRVYTTNGDTTDYTCPGDGNADEISFMVNGNSNSKFQYVVTDDQGNILGLPPGNTVNFEGAGIGNCLVWGLSYTGNLTAQMGDNALTTHLSDDCFDLSDNFVTVNRDDVDGGRVYTVDGDTTDYTCPGDGNADAISFMVNGNSNSKFQYVVTDDQGTILGLPPGNTVDFEGAGIGNCLVWGLSYTGNLTAQMGDNALTTHLSDDCFDLSDNFVTVNRDDVDGGRVYTVDGDTTDYTCPGDGNADAISFMVNGNSNSKFQYVVTDDQGTILGLPPGNTVDFEGAGIGNCLVWGLSYTGNLTAQMGDNALTTHLSDDCFDLSDNFVTVNRDDVDGGRVYTVDGDTTDYTCPGDGNADEISFMVNGNSNSKFQYVVTDDQGNILGLPPGNTVNFEGAGIGNCLVWGLSYTGNLTAQMGDNALTTHLSDDCFDLSDNFVTVMRDEVDGGRIYTTSADTAVYTCPGDGIADAISFMSSGKSNSRFRYVVTDEQGNILGLPPGNTVDFEGAGVGTCLVWGLAYTGTVTAQMGDNALTTNLSDDCFDLSDNYVRVERNTNNCVGSFTLINARSDSDLQRLNDGDVIILNQLPTSKLNVRADFMDGNVESVEFKLNGRRVRVENVAPYALAGDRNGDYFAISNIQAGTYTLMATPYDRNGARGTAGTPLMITFTVISSQLEIASFTLVDADTDTDIGPLRDGDVIDPASLGVHRFSVRANTNPGIVGSVVFGINGRHRTENFAPYALGGDRNGNYYPVNFRDGTNTLSATAHEKRNSMGDVGMTEMISFTYRRPNGNRDLDQDISMLVYPNPGQGKINLELSDLNAGTVEINVLNLQGARVFSEKVESQGGVFLHKLNLESLSAGSYFLNLKAGDQVFREKIIKQ